MKDDGSCPVLVVMLTHNDFTTENAEKIFEQCKNTNAKYWGFKEKPLSKDRMKKLVSRMKDCGKITVLEVVAYTAEEGLAGAMTAAECGCDVLMGTKFNREISDFCRAQNLKYMPFVGNLEGRPSVLTGSIDDIIKEARYAIANGAYGIDLLGYRYVGDVKKLITRLVRETEAPVCVAGSVDCYDKLDEIKEFNPMAFTIGSAFFENKFDGNFAEQINKVCDYMTR